MGTLEGAMRNCGLLKASCWSTAVVLLQRLVPRQPRAAAGPRLPVARAGCCPAARAARRLVLSSGPPLPAGAPGAGGGSSSHGAGQLCSWRERSCSVLCC